MGAVELETYENRGIRATVYKAINGRFFAEVRNFFERIATTPQYAEKWRLERFLSMQFGL